MIILAKTNFMKKLLFAFAVVLLFVSCTNTQHAEKEIPLQFSEEMLFEGANTLQMPANMRLEDLAASLDIPVENILSIGVSAASINVTDEQNASLESLLLQVVSDQHALISIGTLSPVENAGSLSLSIAEEVDLLPYLKDNCTYVLDVNIANEDISALMLQGELTLDILYSEK